MNRFMSVFYGRDFAMDNSVKQIVPLITQILSFIGI